MNNMMRLLPLAILFLSITTTVLCDDAHINGTWSAVYDWPLAPIHLVLLKTGKILSYGNMNNGSPEDKFYFDVWDPTTNTHLTRPVEHGGNVNTNIFCSGQVTVPTDGKVLITGGSQTFNGTRNYGVTDTQIFDPDTETMQIAQHDMHYARWYPSVTVLGNTHIVAQGGTGDTNPKRAITVPEVYNPNTGRWRVLTGANDTMYLRRGAWWFPRAYAARRNTVIVFVNNRNEIWKLDPRGEGSIQVVGTVPGRQFNYRAPACMFDRNKILAIQDVQDASVIDITNPNAPTVQATGSLREKRYWSDTVALPNGEVLIVGGASVIQSEQDAVKYVEIWNPTTGEWRVGGAGAKSRLYHSTALLLPDATVLVAGGGPPGPVQNHNHEIYEPPYLFNADGSRATRPVISSLSTHDPRYGDVIQVNLQSPTNVARVSLIRLGSVTHSFNMDERMIRLSRQRKSSTLVDVRFGFGRSVAPPGLYMLFVVDSDGVPSEAKIVNLQ